LYTAKNNYEKCNINIYRLYTSIKVRNIKVVILHASTVYNFIRCLEYYTRYTYSVLIGKI